MQISITNYNGKHALYSLCSRPSPGTQASLVGHATKEDHGNMEYQHGIFVAINTPTRPNSYPIAHAGSMIGGGKGAAGTSAACSKNSRGEGVPVIR